MVSCTFQPLKGQAGHAKAATVRKIVNETGPEYLARPWNEYEAALSQFIAARQHW
jgi:hypothetical protein